MPKPITSTRRTGSGSSFTFNPSNPLGPTPSTQGFTGYSPSYGTTNADALIGSVVTRAQVARVVRESQQKLQADVLSRYQATQPQAGLGQSDSRARAAASASYSQQSLPRAHAQA